MVSEIKKITKKPTKTVNIQLVVSEKEKRTRESQKNTVSLEQSTYIKDQRDSNNDSFPNLRRESKILSEEKGYRKTTY